MSLTDGERVTIGRRRAGVTQGKFAALHDVKQAQVSRWELGTLPVPPHIIAQYRRLGRLSQAEAIMLLRRRNNLYIRECANMHNVSRYQWIKIEAGEVNDPAALKLMQEYNETWQGN